MHRISVHYKDKGKNYNWKFSRWVNDTYHKNPSFLVSVPKSRQTE